MKRKVFYILKRKRYSICVEEVDGFEFIINDSKFYGYINRECGKAYIIDPETGKSIYDYPVFEEIQEINAIRNTIDMLIEDKHFLEAFEKKKGTEEYGLMKESFESFMHGIELNFSGGKR